MLLLRLDIILESKNDLTIFHKMFFSPILVKCLTQDPRETNNIQKLKPKKVFIPFVPNSHARKVARDRFVRNFSCSRSILLAIMSNWLS